MRTAALPNFRKFYRIINHTETPFEFGLPKGNYILNVVYSEYCRFYIILIFFPRNFLFYVYYNKYEIKTGLCVFLALTLFKILSLLRALYIIKLILAKSGVKIVCIVLMMLYIRNTKQRN